jgi:hypothetical protein
LFSVRAFFYSYHISVSTLFLFLFHPTGLQLAWSFCDAGSYPQFRSGMAALFACWKMPDPIKYLKVVVQHFVYFEPTRKANMYVKTLISAATDSRFFSG